ncbi:hypothetical protein AB0H40_13805 [Streptomyces filamentosus]|uniref:hypothetical protein n=1 Tax=Streptomyces filamentosus TaxID=67294 RepID=UPI003400FA82
MAPAPRSSRGAPLLAAAAVTLSAVLSATPEAGAVAPAPVCGDASAPGFPLATRIRSGPAEYPAGGAFASWELEVRNTTGAPCAGVHPVLVLTDEERALRPEQIRLEFWDAGSVRWRPVAFEATEEAENVGAFTGTEDPGGPSGTEGPGDPFSTEGPGDPSGATDPDGFAGFAVPARRTVTIPVRLAFRADAVPDEVVVNAALVQRRGADGDWVGRSGDYRLTIGPPDPDPDPDPDASRPLATPPAPSGTAPPPTAPATPPRTTPATPATPATPPRNTPTAPPPADTAPAPLPPSAHPPAPHRPELARTGRETAALLAPWAAALVLAGALLARSGRRLRGA